MKFISSGVPSTSLEINELSSHAGLFVLSLPIIKACPLVYPLNILFCETTSEPSPSMIPYAPWLLSSP